MLVFWDDLQGLSIFLWWLEHDDHIEQAVNHGGFNSLHLHYFLLIIILIHGSIFPDADVLPDIHKLIEPILFHELITNDQTEDVPQNEQCIVDDVFLLI